MPNRPPVAAVVAALPRGKCIAAVVLLVALFCATAVAGCQREGAAADGAGAGESREATGVEVHEGQAPNALINEQSLYLQQHAYNPVYWYPWGEAALTRARSENKLVFLSIGYSSCHWCHVMEQEVFIDQAVGDYLNEHFICIKVDREERPDIDALYMEALLVLQGSGGWPLNMFLTPDLKPFFGGTYMPKEEFLARARRIQELYEADPQSLADAGSQLVEYISAEPDTGQGGEYTLSDMGRLVAGMRQGFDATWGGRQAVQKFPSPVQWRFLLHYYRKTGDAAAEKMLRLTLDRMSDGGLQDQLGGGFHRYTVDRQWVVPHFEKMLYDNAQLASLYTEAAAVFESPGYRESARRTLDFMLDELSDGAGLFASLDADSGGVEGSYYIWNYDEVVELAGEKDGAVLAQHYGITRDGNFEGENVLTCRADPAAVASAAGLSAAEVAEVIARWREPMLALRAKRDAPGLDQKVVTAWNGLAISALAQGYASLGDARYLDAARSAADYVLAHNRGTDGALARASTNGVAAGVAVLDDYAGLACGLFELYSASGEPKYLGRALELVDGAVERFARPAGGYYLTDTRVSELAVRKFIVHDSVEPSGNSLMAQALLQAAAITGESRYYSLLDQLFASHASLLQGSGVEMAWLADAKLKADGPYYDVVLAGDLGQGAGAAMLASFNGLSPCNAVLIKAEPGRAATESAALVPALKEKQPGAGGEPLGYVCIRGACKKPAASAEELQAQLRDGWAH